MPPWLSVQIFKWTFLMKCRHMELYWLFLRLEQFRMQLINKIRYQDISENIIWFKI